jgi:hypothetical protein
MNAFKEEIPLILSSLAHVTFLAIEWNLGIDIFIFQY